MRRQLLLFVLGQLLLIGCLTALGGMVSADQLCSNDINHTNPVTRYDQNGDGTATDRQTGLTWQRCPLGYSLDDNGTPAEYADDHCSESGTVRFTWGEALLAAQSLNNAGGYAGFSDWRVPNIKELATLVERKCAEPAINLRVFPEHSQRRFWTTTTYNLIDQAASIDFSQGHYGNTLKTGLGLAVWLVR